MQIRVLQGKGKTIEMDFSLSPLYLGRQDDCQIHILSPAVSKKHLKLEREGGKFYATDLGSTNGSTLNGVKMVPQKRYEWTTYFPIEIGEYIMISLVPETEKTANTARFKKV